MFTSDQIKDAIVRNFPPDHIMMMVEAHAESVASQRINELLRRLTGDLWEIKGELEGRYAARG